ncbi:MAG: outer membrane protein assembly factor BamA [Endomicrobium sp.]|jgi:outer membrane protein insertion porin family|nr:outer membrane protein assembly factor BamA [Endomicrobium sp.]
MLFKKVSLIILVFTPIFFLYPQYTIAKNIVSGILIEGLKNVNQNEIFSILTLKNEKKCSNDLIKKNISSILKLGYFDNINYSYNNGILKFIVTEKPYIENISFKGNLKISENKIKNIIPLKIGEYYDHTKLKISENKIKNLYKNLGFMNCKVNNKIEYDTNTNKIKLIFNIIENNKIKCINFKINGANFLSKKPLINLLFKKKINQNFNINKGLDLLNSFYKKNGFIDFNIIDTKIIFNDTKTKALLIVYVNEGIRYTIGNITWYGNYVVNKKKLFNISQLNSGNIFDQQKIIKTIKNVYELYHNIGYFNINVSTSIKPNKKNNNILDIEFYISEGQLNYINNIYINGVNSMIKEIIRKEINLHSGDILKFEELNKIVASINNLGFIKKTEIQIEDSEIPNAKNIFFNIEDIKKMYTLNFGFRYYNPKKIAGITQFNHFNFLGLGQKLTCNLKKELSNNQYSVSIKQPIDKKLELGINIMSSSNNNNFINMTNNIKLNKPKKTNYKNKFSIYFITKKISKNISLFFGYDFSNISFNENNKNNNTVNFIKVQNKFFKHNLNTINIAGLKAKLMYDSKNRISNPTKGETYSFSIKCANKIFGGDINLIKNIINYNNISTIFWKLILKTDIELGIIFPYKEVNNYKFYSNDHINKSNDTYNRYGNYKLIINIENKLPILNLYNNPLQGLIFYNIGGIWNQIIDITDTEKIYMNIGCGIEFLNSVFPIRLCYSYGINNNKYKNIHNIYFNVGNFL